MKRASSFILIGVLLLWAITLSAQPKPDEVKWHHRYEEAVAQAAVTHTPILMVFAGSDWCKPCIMLQKEVWDTEVFRQYASENLVLLELDFPRFKKNQLPAEQTKANEQLASQYNPDGVFPLVVLLNEQGHVLANTGYQPGGPEKYIAHLEQILHNQ